MGLAISNALLFVRHFRRSTSDFASVENFLKFPPPEIPRMASEMIDSEADHLVELIVRDEPSSMPDGAPISEEDAPLLTQIEKPKINIFTISYPRRKPMV